MNKLMPGKKLNRKDSLTSDNGEYLFIFQDDGNLVLYKGSDVLWSTNTQDSNVKECVMQEDGNFVLYDYSSNKAAWNSGTCGKNGAYLMVRDDGKVVIYHTSPVWDTGTNHTPTFLP